MAGRRPGEIVELEITGLAYGGQGVGRIEDFVVFAHDLMPGDRAQVRLTKVEKRFAVGRLLSLEKESELRLKKIPCRHVPECGGCTFQQLEYQSQLRYKSEQVADIIQRIGHLKDVTPAPIAGMKNPFRYRNSMEFTVSDSGSGPVAGIHRRHDPDHIIPIQECLLISESMNRIRAFLEQGIRNLGLVPMDPNTGAGDLVALALRENADAETMIGLVTRTGLGRRAMGQVKTLGEKVFHEFPEVIGVAQETRRGRFQRKVHWSPLFGRDFFLDRFGGVKCRVSYGSFSQGNRKGLEPLLARVRELFPAADRALDAYCGVGLMGLGLAEKAGAWVGVEENSGAVADAQFNAALNGKKNFGFVAGRLERMGIKQLGGKFSAAVMDPPRTGLGEHGVDLISSLGVKNLVYVSCSPPSLARDIGRLVPEGWRLRGVWPFDLFPHTHHIECVAHLTKK